MKLLVVHRWLVCGFGMLCGSLSAHAAEPAASVYRCSAGGAAVYSDAPCPGGQPIDAADRRTETERLAAARLAERDKLQAARWDDRQRHALDNLRPAVATPLSAAPATSAAVKGRSKSTRPHRGEAGPLANGDFVAYARAAPKKAGKSSSR